MTSEEHLLQSYLDDLLEDTHDDPLMFVLRLFPWGEDGTPLQDMEGPWPWQREFLEHWGQEIKARNFDGRTPVEAIRYSIRSGNGVGKTTLFAWIALFLFFTRPDSAGTVLSIDFKNLKKVVWSEIMKWFHLSGLDHLAKEYLSDQSMELRHLDNPLIWRLQTSTAGLDKKSAMQGLHRAHSTTYFICDECAEYEQGIYEAMEGCMTEGSPMIFEAGNPTLATGPLVDHHRHPEQMKLWNRRNISRLDVFGPEDPWSMDRIAEHGYKSNFVRTRVLGDFPDQTMDQFISYEDIRACQVLETLYDSRAKLIWGIDIAREGDDLTVIYPRKGRLADGERHQIWTLDDRDTMSQADKIADRMLMDHPDHVYVDATGVGGPVVDRLRQMGFKQVEGVNSTWKPNEPYAGNFRASMFMRLKEAIARREIKLPMNPRITEELGSLQYELKGPEDTLMLEPKKNLKSRLGRSPDYADSLALTYSYRVKERKPSLPRTRLKQSPFNFYRR